MRGAGLRVVTHGTRWLVIARGCRQGSDPSGARESADNDVIADDAGADFGFEGIRTGIGRGWRATLRSLLKLANGETPVGIVGIVG